MDADAAAAAAVAYIRREGAKIKHRVQVLKQSQMIDDYLGKNHR